MQRKTNKYEYPQWDNRFSTAMKILWIHLKKLFTDRILLKIISVFFAILLWGYIATESNPQVDKKFHDVPVSLQSMSSLNASGLAVADDLVSLLEEGIDIETGVTIKSYNAVLSSDLEVALDLSGVNAAGTHRVPVVVRSNHGDMAVKSYSPRYIDVRVDPMESRVLPVSVEFTGNLSAKLWRGEPTLAAKEITVRGASSVVGEIAKAYISIDQSQLKNSLKGDTFPVILEDQEGNAVSKNMLNMSAYMAVDMEVLIQKAVEFDFENSLINADKLKEGYELAGSSYTYPSGDNQIILLGSEKQLADYEAQYGNKVRIESGIDRNGRSSEIISMEATLSLPEGIKALHGDQISLNVNITEKKAEKILEVPLQMEKPSSWRLAISSASVASVKVSVSGPALKVEKLNIDSIQATVNLRGLDAGVHSLPIEVTGVPDGVKYTLDSTIVTVVLKER